MAVSAATVHATFTKLIALPPAFTIELSKVELTGPKLPPSVISREPSVEPTFTPILFVPLLTPVLISIAVPPVGVAMRIRSPAAGEASEATSFTGAPEGTEADTVFKTSGTSVEVFLIEIFRTEAPKYPHYLLPMKQFAAQSRKSANQPAKDPNQPLSMRSHQPIQPLRHH